MDTELKELRDAAVAEAKGPYKLAAELGITPAAISQWTRIPHERVIKIEEITGIRREQLRPDLYPKD